MTKGNKKYFGNDRRCYRCKQLKILTDFCENKTKTRGHSYLCKSCRKETRKKSDRLQEYKKTRATIEIYERLLNEQNGKCAICGKTPDKKRLAVDHSHVTQKIRGLLCVNCNTGLGCFHDSQHLLISAINYIRGEA